jgi:Tol biopolymer transport system component
MGRLRFASASLAVALILVASSSRADEPMKKHDITIDDYFTLAFISELAISPDGKSVAYAEGRWQSSTDDRKADLWVADAGTGEATRLTYDRAGCSSLRWGSDSKQIYFAAGRKREGVSGPPYDGKTQVWRIPVGGGEPLAITQVPGGIDRFGIAGDGRMLFYSTSRQEAGGEWASLRQQFGNVQYGHGKDELTEIYKLDLRNWRAEKVAGVKKAVSEMAVAADGRRLALITAPEDKVLSFEGSSAVEILEVATRSSQALPDALWRAQAPSPYGRLNSLAWSKNGRSLAFVIAFDGYPSEIIIARWNGNRKAPLGRRATLKGGA